MTKPDADLAGAFAYLEFEDALSAVLNEEEYSLERWRRLAKARAAIDRTDPRYREAVRRANMTRTWPG
jgi:hypothetical protein